MPNIGVQYQGVITDGQLTPAAVSSYLAIPGTATLDQAVSGAAVWAAAIDGVVDGAFTQVAVYLTPPLPGGLKSPTGATWLASRVQQTGVFDFTATGTTRLYGQALPSIANSVLANNKIDMSNPDVIAFVDLILNPTDLFTNPQLQALEVLLEAFVSFRKHSQLPKRSLALQP